MKQKMAIAGLVVLLISGICVLENGAVSSRPAGAPARGDSSVYALAGEFRTVFANLLWIKVDCYHHEFIERGRPWTSNRELTGLLDMITMLDPHFVQAYSVGAYVYAYGYKDPHRAARYLRQGMCNNPRSWELYRVAAILRRPLHNPRAALTYARRAVACCDDELARPHIVSLLKTIQRINREGNSFE